MSIGSLVIDLKGKELDKTEREQLAHPLVGGVILFSRNYQDKRQLQALCQQIRSSRTEPLLIMADQEGGRVQRFKNEFFHLPPMGYFGQLYHSDRSQALSLTRDAGYLLAMELLSCGLDLSLGPVLDLDSGISHVIGNRAFDADPAIVIELATEFVKGMRHAGMAPVVKHFPGHGSIEADSHIAIAIDDRPFEQIQQKDMLTFAQMVEFGVPAIMAAHVIYPQVDDKPVGYSSKWLKEVLRQQLGFAGAIFSDDLSMEAANISGYYPDRVQAAREAGCDFLLLCNHPEAITECLDQLRPEQFMVSEERWKPLMRKYVESDLQSAVDSLQLIQNRIKESEK